MKQSGFTLIEVLVSLVVLTIGIIAVVTLITGSQKNAIVVQEKTVAWFIADSCFSRLRALHIEPISDWQESEQARLDVEAAASGKIKKVLLIIKKIDSSEKASYGVTLNFTMQSGQTLSYTSVIAD